jgi:hypothetical protein
MLTQGPGKTKSVSSACSSGGIFAQLASKLNPFAAQDPYTQLDCTVARVDIVDGHATVEPVLMQSQKVTITAEGKVNLQTEELTVDFNTRPREGIGVSPGMFTNPFIKLEGTLASQGSPWAPRVRHPARSPQQLQAHRWSRRDSWTALAERRTCAGRRSKRAARGAAPADGSAKEAPTRESRLQVRCGTYRISSSRCSRSAIDVATVARPTSVDSRSDAVVSMTRSTSHRAFHKPWS